MTKSLAFGLYKGKGPGDVPFYFIGEAAQNLRLPTATVRSWVIGRPYRVNSGTATFRPPIKIADSDNQLLSFHNLVELHVLSSIRRTYKVQLQAVRKAVEFLQKGLESKHPLLDQRMLTDGKDLFIERYGQLVNVSQNGQLAMKQILASYLERIVWDDSGVPVRLFPFSRDNFQEAPRFISIDPKIRFGKPCLAGTGIQTAIIAERHKAGESIASLSKDYGRHLQEVEEAIRYESRIAS